MNSFFAGIMQGSHAAACMHDQDYRQRFSRLLETHFPGAVIYDPLAKHKIPSATIRRRAATSIFHHNRMCREVDVLVAFVPDKSMGTAIECGRPTNMGPRW